LLQHLNRKRQRRIVIVFFLSNTNKKAIAAIAFFATTPIEKKAMAINYRRLLFLLKHKEGGNSRPLRCNNNTKKDKRGR